MFHESLKELDEILNKDYENIILLLYDGLGDYNINNVLDKNDFLIKNKVKVIDSVFPTTTAATTSVLSGLNPIEHGWFGWNLYIKDIDKTITIFRNIAKLTQETFDYNIAKKYFGYTNIVELINDENNNDKAYLVSLFEGEKYNEKSIDDMHSKIIDICKEKIRKFIYGYNVEPDSLMHEFEVSSEVVKNKIKEINNKTEKLCNSLDNGLIIVIADHGHINCKCLLLKDYPNLDKMIDKPLSIESRVVNFFVKDEYKIDGISIEFEKEFNKLFSNDFILMSKNEIIKNKLFGEGNANERFESSLGDYIAIANW